jgi:hypothetical protein
VEELKKRKELLGWKRWAGPQAFFD